MNKNQVAWVSGLAGLGLVLLGGAMYAYERKAQSLGLLNGLGRSRAQAPVIGRYSDGRMETTLRESAKMPIEERIATIQDLIHKSVQDPKMRKLALQATSACGERDKVCEAKAVYDFVKSRVRYTGDVGPIKMPNGQVEGIDLYQSARRTLEFGGGDCDDNAILVSTLLALNGHQPILRVVKARRDPDWSHIFVVDNIDGKVVALDTTLPGNRSFGIEANYAKKIDFPA